MHQTGWTGLVANLVQRKYRDDIPAYWRRELGRYDAVTRNGGASPGPRETGARD